MIGHRDENLKLDNEINSYESRRRPADVLNPLSNPPMTRLSQTLERRHGNPQGPAMKCNMHSHSGPKWCLYVHVMHRSGAQRRCDVQPTHHLRLPYHLPTPWRLTAI